MNFFLAFILLIITLLGRGFSTDNLWLTRTGAALILPLIVSWVKTQEYPFIKTLKTINTRYITLPLFIITLWMILQNITQGARSHTLLARISLLISSIQLNISMPTIGLMFGPKTMTDEDAAMIISFMTGVWITQTYWFSDPLWLYIAASTGTWIVFTVLHTVFYKNPDRLVSLPYFLVITVISVSACLRSIGSFIVQEYSETTIQEAKIQEGKLTLPNWFPPEPGPKIVSGEDTLSK
ncbi:MAG: hypothetical protein WC004_04910 [Candidatus Absconditabacterales bacterium]